MSDVTRILNAIEHGDPHAADELLPLVYEQLRQLAAKKLAHESPDQTLQPTALVHEAWLRLVGNQRVQWDGRAHFFAAAAEAMRRILINNARRKRAIRHGGGQQRVNLEGIDVATTARDDEMLAVDEALEKLAAHDKTKAELVKLLYFVGMTIPEAASVLGISEPTAKRYWSYSRAWLLSTIEAGQS
jgi:RNA polymerase sigma factor (TIGR02999 family)